MNDIYGHFLLFLLILVRISCMIVTMPFFNSRNSPVQLKIGFSVLLSWLALLTLYTPDMGLRLVALHSGAFILFIIREALVGLCIGFLANLTFVAVQFAGQFLDLQSGFSTVMLFDPQNNQTLSVFSNFKYLLVTLLFLLEDGHHALIEAMVQSFQYIAVDSFSGMNAKLLDVLVESFSVLFLLALKISVPLIGALFLTDVALAILSRAVPQMNVFVLGLPIKIFLSFLLLLFLMPTLASLFHALFQVMFQQIDDALHALGGGTR
jgi:flagellar biosynthesis protein FliR